MTSLSHFAQHQQAVFPYRMFHQEYCTSPHIDLNKYLLDQAAFERLAQ